MCVMRHDLHAEVGQMLYFFSTLNRIWSLYNSQNQFARTIADMCTRCTDDAFINPLYAEYHKLKYGDTSALTWIFFSWMFCDTTPALLLGSHANWVEWNQCNHELLCSWSNTQTLHPIAYTPKEKYLFILVLSVCLLLCVRCIRNKSWICRRTDSDKGCGIVSLGLYTLWFYLCFLFRLGKLEIRLVIKHAGQDDILAHPRGV